MRNHRIMFTRCAPNLVWRPAAEEGLRQLGGLWVYMLPAACLISSLAVPRKAPDEVVRVVIALFHNSCMLETNHTIAIHNLFKKALHPKTDPAGRHHDSFP